MDLIPEEDGGDDYYLNGAYTKLKDAGKAYGGNAVAEQEKKQESEEPPEEETEEQSDEEPGESKNHAERHAQRKAERRGKAPQKGR